MTEHRERAELGRKREDNKKLVLRALTDPGFRKLLQTNPSEAVGKPLTSANEQEIRFVLAAVKSIEAQIAGLADELLCANGGCGIAAE